MRVERLAKRVEEAADHGDWSAALEAAKEIADDAGRELLWSVVNGARAADPSMTDTEIARVLGVTQPAVYERFPPPEPKWRRKADESGED